MTKQRFVFLANNEAFWVLDIDDAQYNKGPQLRAGLASNPTVLIVDNDKVVPDFSIWDGTDFRSPK
jgi:hypothetical protein